MTPKEVLALCRQYDVQTVYLRFADLAGAWRHVAIPVERLTEDLFEEGISIDGSQALGRQVAEQADLLIIPRPETAFLDPLLDITTLNLICNAQDPLTQEDYPGDPRNIARAANAFLLNTGIADAAGFGSEIEFYILDGGGKHGGGHGNRHGGRHSGGGGDRKQGRDHRWQSRSLVSADGTMDLRNRMMQELIRCGVKVDRQLHGFGSAARSGISLQFDDPVRLADQLMTCKYVVKQVARQQGKSATFMPKPIFGEDGSGMHVHFSLWKDSQPLFAGNEYAGLSETALFAVGGILRHAPALLAITNPSTNSYRRLMPGCDAPVQIAYSQRNHETICRVPVCGAGPDARRVEFPCPDSSSNPYLAFASILMAVIDGIQNKIHPGEPLETSSDSSEQPDVRQIPRSLAESLRALSDDRQFLLRGDVFSNAFIDAWIENKQQDDIDALQQRPHPHEFHLYYDV